jgi:hypothetical protein
VNEIQYNLIGNDTLNYQLKETFFDSLVSNDQITYLLRREKRDNPTDPWTADSVWTVSRTSNSLVITENNVPFVKLTFPVSLGNKWDGNILNTKSPIIYYYESVTDNLVDSVATEDHIRLIIEDVTLNVVNQDERSETYVRGLGLVAKNYLTLQFCTVDCNKVGEIQSGRYLDQILIEVGNE